MIFAKPLSLNHEFSNPDVNILSNKLNVGTSIKQEFDSNYLEEIDNIDIKEEMISYSESQVSLK